MTPSANPMAVYRPLIGLNPLLKRRVARKRRSRDRAPEAPNTVTLTRGRATRPSTRTGTVEDRFGAMSLLATDLVPVQLEDAQHGVSVRPPS